MRFHQPFLFNTVDFRILNSYTLILFVFGFWFYLVYPCLVPAPAPLLDADKYQRHSLQRPFSFTQGTVPEAAFSQALGAQLGILISFFCLIFLHAATATYQSLQHDVGV